MAGGEKRRGAERAFAFLMVFVGFSVFWFSVAFLSAFLFWWQAFGVLLVDQQHSGPRKLWCVLLSLVDLISVRV